MLLNNQEITEEIKEEINWTSLVRDLTSRKPRNTTRKKEKKNFFKLYTSITSKEKDYSYIGRYIIFSNPNST